MINEGKCIDALLAADNVEHPKRSELIQIYQSALLKAWPVLMSEKSKLKEALAHETPENIEQEEKRLDEIWSEAWAKFKIVLGDDAARLLGGD